MFDTPMSLLKSGKPNMKEAKGPKGANSRSFAAYLTKEKGIDSKMLIKQMQFYF